MAYRQRFSDYHAMSLKSRIEMALKHGQLNQTDLAKRLNITRSAVSQWVTGATVPDGRRIEQIAGCTGVRPEWLAYGTEPMAAANEEQRLRDMADFKKRYREPGAATVTSVMTGQFSSLATLIGTGERELRVAIRAMETDLPVLGGFDEELGLFVIDPQNPIGFTGRPAQLDGISNAYALTVPNSQMDPAFKVGHMIYVNPTKRPLPGDDVVLVAKNGEFKIRELIESREGVLETRAYEDGLREGEDPDLYRLHLIVLTTRIRL